MTAEAKGAIGTGTMHEARQYTKLDDQVVHCSVCAHRCRIKEGGHGICGVRLNRKGILYAATYG